jgi:glycosyltransferase involved in cell wall biosynthesis
MSNFPGISVVIPCFNQGSFLAEAVDSVLAQSHDDFEIVVVDDGSEDDTPERVKTLPGHVRYLRQENAGPAAARNHGLRVVRHDLVAFLDADDLWPPERTNALLRHFQENPALDFVIGNQRHFGPRDVAKSPEGDASAPEGSREYEFEEAYFIFLVGCGLFRRRVFDKVGGFTAAARSKKGF